MILLISPKKVYATKRFIKEAKKLKVALKAFDAKDLAKGHFKVDVKKYQTLFVRQGWPYEKEIIALAEKFHRAGKKVIDASITTGSLGRDKWADYQKLKALGLPIPKTIRLKDFKSSPLSLVPSSCMIKWNFGFKARGVFLVKSEDQLKSIIKRYPKRELLVQEFIPAEYEYKVITVGYKTLPVILRFKVNPITKRPDFRKTKIFCHPKLDSGSKMDSSLRWNDRMQQLVRLAEKASKVLKRELAKIDVLEAKGKYYILEVNRWPGLKSFEELTKYNVAREFVRYLRVK